jgi:hypothetical protein
VRMITYTPTDLALPRYAECHVLLTPLRDLALALVLKLVLAYHKRWGDRDPR